MQPDANGRSPRVLVIGGSIRSTGKKDAQIRKLVAEVDGVDALRTALDPATAGGLHGLSNSEILSALAMYGVREAGGEPDYFSLRRLFPVEDTPRLTAGIEGLGLDDQVTFIDTTVVDSEVLSKLLEKTAWADSVIIATPVYFGDRSSVTDVLLKILHQEGALQGKGFSVVSVGAKRNGGQETTNVYALFDALHMGACITGNGPKTSQYGGTAVAGDKGLVLSDDFGIETTVATGRRTAQVARILSAGHQATDADLTKPRIAVLVSADNAQREVEHRVRAYLDEVEADFDVLNLLDFRVERCLGCKICPFPDAVENGPHGHHGETDYACIIDNGKDGVEVVRERLKEMDGLLIVGLNDDLHYPNLVDSYQSFTERTRFIRRADFEWTNTPFASFVMKDVAATRDRLFGLRAMTSYMRHNAIACTPVRALTLGDELVKSPADDLRRFVDQVARIRHGRRQAGSVEVSYVAGGTGGYRDTRLDHTSAVRS